MKNLRILAIAMITVVSLNSCSKDDNKAVNEEEVITTVTTTLTGGGQTIFLKSKDLDGDGPNAPVVTVSGPLTAGINYTGTVSFLNEIANPNSLAYNDVKADIKVNKSDSKDFEVRVTTEEKIKIEELRVSKRKKKNVNFKSNPVEITDIESFKPYNLKNTTHPSQPGPNLIECCCIIF